MAIVTPDLYDNSLRSEVDMVMTNQETGSRNVVGKLVAWKPWSHVLRYSYDARPGLHFGGAKTSALQILAFGPFIHYLERNQNQIRVVVVDKVVGTPNIPSYFSQSQKHIPHTLSFTSIYTFYLFHIFTT